MTREVPEDGHGAAAVSLTEQIAEVLAGHLWHHTRDTHCACGWRSPLAQLAVEGYTDHVASQLARLVEREKREAWAEGFDAGERDAFDLTEHPNHECIPNPYARD